MTTPRAVLDTTVLVSAFLTGHSGQSVTGELLRRGRRGTFQLCLSSAIVEEARSRLLHRPRLRKAYGYSDDRVHRFCRGLQAFARLVNDLPAIAGVVRDPADDVIVATAVAATADYLVTRDKDLLALGSYQGVRMITPEAFMGILRGT